MVKRLFSILAALLFMAGTAPLAQAELAAVGPPINPHGFPSYYEDTTGLQLEPCLPAPAGFATRPELCVFDPLDENSPLVVAGEFFWWLASATIGAVGGGDDGVATLTLGIEGTFGGSEAAIDGQQISFGRTRIRVDTPVAGTYTVTHPYGVQVFVVTDPAEGINYTADIGAANFLDPANGFLGTLSAPIGPFLTWADYATDPALQVLAEDGVTVLEQYVGDPTFPNTVVGSPNNTNFFRVQGPNGFDVQTDLFSVMGKVYDPNQIRTAHVFPEAPFPILYAVGPVNRVAPFAEPTTATVTGVDLPYPVGYPIWYQENIGTITEPAGGLKVTLCTPGDPMCISDPIDPSVPAQVALRTGGEGFWWSADATIDYNGDDFDLILGLEATFGGDESLIDGNQIAFMRERIRIDTNVAGAGFYRITHPYGVRIYEATTAGPRGINETADIGITNPADPDGAFVGAMYSLGPQLLKWTTFNANPALTDARLIKPDINDPTRTNYFVGDPAIEMTVTGSPTGNNFFRVEKLTSGTLDNGTWQTLGQTNLFAVSGQVFDPVALGVSPLVDNTMFVRQVYLDFLNREGDPAGIEYWVGRLDAQTITRAQLVEGFMLSPEFGQVVSPLVRLYYANFLRNPDFEGLMFWLDRLTTQASTLDDIANFFAGSAEFQQLYGTLTNEEFVQLVYQNVLGREADAGGLAFWTTELETGNRTRGQVMLGFSESAEYTGQTTSEVYANMVIAGLVQRTATAEELAIWVGQLDGGAPGLTMIEEYINSAEYLARF